jgi:proline iminopeptidase
MLKQEMLLILASLFIFAFLIPACRTEKPSFKELKVKTPNVTLYARMAGNPAPGQVLIAINGGPGLSSHYMLNLDRLAGPEFAVVTYDQRGVSRSTSPPPDASNYDLMKYVEDLAAVQKAIGVESVSLLGHSWGGLVALRYATVYPEKVGSIVLMGSGPPTWEGIAKGQTSFGQRIQKLQQQGIIPQDLQQASIEVVLPAYFSNPKFWFSPDDKGRPIEYNDTVYRLTLSTLEGYDITADVAKLNHRVLILWGEDDPFGLAMAEETKKALSQAKVKFVVLKKCGHFWHECPDEFFARVRAFLGLPAAN